jgi:hypothetical protein
MKNIHLIPTDKPSNLVFEKLSNRFYTNSRRKSNTNNLQNQNIYITSDGEIKEGDWCYNSINNNVYKKEIDKLSFAYEYKIILTTDQDLINDGVQTIVDEFLEWFVKNPNCESVDVDKNWNYPLDKSWEYKIIIPREEAKQETIEEAAEKYSEKFHYAYGQQSIFYQIGFKEGAKWQAERMYSEEEVLEIIRQYALEEHLITTSKPDIWFEQFKKK